MKSKRQNEQTNENIRIRIEKNSGDFFDHYDQQEDSKKDTTIGMTSWRGRNPKITKAKKKDLIIPNRFDFGNDAPIRYRNFAWLKKNHRKDYFGVNKVEGKNNE